MFNIKKALPKILIGMIVVYWMGFYPNAYAQVPISGFTQIVTDVTKVIKSTNTTAIKPVIDQKVYYETKVQGSVQEWKATVNGEITDMYDSASSWVSEQGGAVASWAEDKGNAIASWASDQGSAISSWASDTFGGGAPGSGFSMKDLKCDLEVVKKGISKIGKTVAPVATLMQNPLAGAIDIKKQMYVGDVNSEDKLSTYDTTTVMQNVKQYVQDATKTTLVDATQVINGSVTYSDGKKSVSSCTTEGANKASNVKEDIKLVNDMGISTNVMTNVLLSMDITELSVNSTLVYEDINGIKNMFSKTFQGGMQ